MKKLTLLSEESIFSGSIKCGIAEVVDSLANSLTENYEVSVICLDGNGKMGRQVSDLSDFSEGIKYTKFLCVNYYLIHQDFWPKAAINLLNILQPEIVHNFYLPDLIKHLTYKPQKMVFTFDSKEILLQYKEDLQLYDFVTSFSKGYIDFLLLDEESNEVLQTLKIRTPSFGILSNFFDPQKGITLPSKYGALDQTGKFICKVRLLERLRIKEFLPLYVTMCRLVEEKGIKQILKNIDFFQKNDSLLLIIGEGKESLKEEIELFLKDNKNIIFINHSLPATYVPSIMAGADFYLQPSIMESGGIMPLVASNYGAIPIVTQNGGLKDNFNQDNAIIVSENNLEEALQQSTKLYKNNFELMKKREKVMTQPFSWEQRKHEIISIYEE